MNPVEKLVGRSPQYLFPRGASISETRSLSSRLSHAAHVWAKDVIHFRRDPREVLVAYREDNSSESQWEHVLDGLEFAERADTADRASNGLREAIKVHAHDYTQESRWGDMVYQAFNNPRLADHNHEHNRRLERWMEAMMQHIGALRHGETIYEWIDSAFLFAYWHDVDQLTSLQRNYVAQATGILGSEHYQKELPVKKGHALAAAVMMLALHERYATERKVRTRDAWDIAAGAAYMMLKHDEPESLMDALSGREPAYKADKGKALIHGKKLLDMFEHNRLDLTTLSPSQMIELLITVKKKHGFIGADNQMGIGLHPEFEKEYAPELAALVTNEEPLFKRIDETRRKSLNLATEAAVRADMIEMVAPPVEAIFRTLATQYSQKRDFMFSDESLARLKEDYNAGKGKKNLPPTELSGMDFFLEAVVNGEGNVEAGSDSDVRRMLWEFLHIEQLSKDSAIATSPYIFKVNRDNAVMGLLAFRDIGSRIMAGDMTDIYDTYGRRIDEVGKKALRKAGHSQLEIAWITVVLGRKRDYIDLVYEQCVRKGDERGAERFRRKATELDHEADTLVAAITNKPSSPIGMEGKEPRVYRDDEIARFRKACDAVLGKLCEFYQVNPAQLRKYKSKAARGKFPPTTPYGSYDSIAPPENIRTFIEPLRILRQDS